MHFACFTFARNLTRVNLIFKEKSVELLIPLYDSDVDINADKKNVSRYIIFEYNHKSIKH